MSSNLKVNNYQVQHNYLLLNNIYKESNYKLGHVWKNPYRISNKESILTLSILIKQLGYLRTINNFSVSRISRIWGQRKQWHFMYGVLSTKHLPRLKVVWINVWVKTNECFWFVYICLACWYFTHTYATKIFAII